MKQLFWPYFRYIMPPVGKWFSKDASAYTYLPESVKVFPEGEDLQAHPARLRFQPMRPASR